MYFSVPLPAWSSPLSLPDALPIFVEPRHGFRQCERRAFRIAEVRRVAPRRHGEAPVRRGATRRTRSEEHTSELQAPDHLACPLLREKKKYIPQYYDRLYVRSVFEI